jgi:hypothetical protein
MANRDHRPIDLEGLPSDAFDTEDFDPEPPHPASDFSSWPAESSPQPGEMEYDSEMELVEPDPYEEDYPGQNEEDYDGQDEDGHDEEDSDSDEELDDASESGMEDDDEEEAEEGGLEEDLEFGFDTFDRDEHYEGEEMADADRQRIVNLITGYHARREEEEEGLFVDQRADFLPPLEELLSTVRRNHARALDLVSELHTEVRNLGHGRAPRNLRENHRHHPYAAPQDLDLAVERVIMNEQRNGSRLRDELVEVEMRPARAAAGRNRAAPLQAQAQPEVIDLTGEPDSPEEPRAIVPPHARASNNSQAHMPGRNPRRRLSLNQRTPSLSRSDGSLLGNQANVIDLTLDDSPVPAPPPLPLPLPRRNNPENQNPHHRHHHHQRRRQPPRAPPIELDHEEGIGARFAGLFRRDFLSFDLIQRLGFGRPHDVEVQVIGGGRLNMDNNPLGGNIPNLDYRVNGSGAAPKPDHVPPPPAREGFTRDTGNADDVIVCPSCERELKYDPDANIEDTLRPAKKVRTRKDHEEHHFWALKDCGHVSLAVWWLIDRLYLFANLSGFPGKGLLQRLL